MTEKGFRDAWCISRRYVAITFQMGKKTRIQVRKQSKKYLHELKKIILSIKESNQVSSNTKHSETHPDTIYFKN